jgi:hypothetical protein
MLFSGIKKARTASRYLASEEGDEKKSLKSPFFGIINSHITGFLSWYGLVKLSQKTAAAFTSALHLSLTTKKYPLFRKCQEILFKKR